MVYLLVARAFLLASEEIQLWGLAGAKGIFLPFHAVVTAVCVCVCAVVRLQLYVVFWVLSLAQR